MGDIVAFLLKGLTGLSAKVQREGIKSYFYLIRYPFTLPVNTSVARIEMILLTREIVPAKLSIKKI
jgi:hypothetical protein